MTYSLVGCGPVGCVVGAEALGEAATGVWFKTRFYRKGDRLCATVYSVAAGEPKIIELEVDIRPIARALMKAHTALHAEELARAAVRGEPLVGWSLGSMWKGVKKVAKKIGRSKLVKGVVAVTKTVAKGAKAVIKSKALGAVLTAASAFPLTAPFAAPVLGAYATANAALGGLESGKKVVDTAKSAASLITQGKKAAKLVTGANAKASAVVKAASGMMPAVQKAAAARAAKAAGRVKLKPQAKMALTTALAKLPPPARAATGRKIAGKVALLAKAKTNLALARALPPAAGAAVVAATKLEVSANPLIAKAAETAKRLQNPNVRKKLVEIRARGEKSKELLTGVQQRAKTGDLDAQKSATIINLVARNRARLQAMSQANAGGLPGLLITPDGKLRRGKFRVQAKAKMGGLLYTGPNKPRERGTFTTVSGAVDLFGEPVEVESGEFMKLESFAVNGDLPLDGVRLTLRTANAGEIGPYEVGCGSSCGCAPCRAAS